MTPTELEFRTMQATDFAAVIAVMKAAYAQQQTFVAEDELMLLSALYPMGQLVCVAHGQIAGVIFSRVVSQARYRQPRLESALRDTRVYADETRDGDSAYILDFFINPAQQQLKVGKRLHQFLEQQIFADNFVTFVGTSRISGFHRYATEMSCEAYVDKVVRRELHDPVLSFHLINGVSTGGIVENFNPEDRESCGYGVTVFLPNPRYDPAQPIYPRRQDFLRALRHGG